MSITLTPLPTSETARFQQELDDYVRVKALCSALGLGSPAACRAGVYRDMGANTYVFRWVGYGGQVYKHHLREWPTFICEIPKDEMNALRLKVMLSTC